jgi:hypothetical protein
MRRLAIDKIPVFGPQTIENLMKQGLFSVAVPRLSENSWPTSQRLGLRHPHGRLHFGTLSHELTVKSLHLFAEEVVPYLRHINEPTATDSDAARQSR